MNEHRMKNNDEMILNCGIGWVITWNVKFDN